MMERRRTKIRWKLFEADTFLARTVQQFGNRELDYGQWCALVSTRLHYPCEEYQNAVDEINRIRVALPLRVAQKNAQLWAYRHFSNN